MARNSFKVVYIIIIIINIAKNIRPAYQSINVASFISFYKFNQVHMFCVKLKWPPIMKLKKLLKTKNQCGLKNINIISKNTLIQIDTL